MGGVSPQGIVPSLVRRISPWQKRKYLPPLRSPFGGVLWSGEAAGMWHSPKGGAGRGLVLCFLFASLEEVLDAADGAEQVGGFVGQIDGLRLVAFGQLLHHLDVLLRKQVVGGVG